MSRATETNLSIAHQAKYEQLEQQRDISSVLLLREMQDTNDLVLKKRLFEQAADQEHSHISEVLNGTVSTDYSFDVDDGKLYLLQPNGVTDWQEMHRNGVARARLKAAIDPKFEPYAKIAEAELRESKVQESLVKNGVPAAIVKLSLCGNDVLSAQSLREIGRDPALQRAFLRVSVFDGQKLHLYSRSIDGLELSNGRGITNGWGVFDSPKVDIAPGSSSVDILNADIQLDETDMPINDMHSLADRLVSSYDKALLERTGKVHKAGRSPEGVDTYKFVEDNLDLMNAHIEGLCELSNRQLSLASLANISNDLRHDIMSSFKQRMEGTWIQAGSLSESVSQAGSYERAQGTQFYGCDSVIGATANVSTTGYVNSGERDKSLMRLSGKKIRCTNKQCKKEVVVPDKDLREGVLSCRECGLVYNVCNSKSSFRGGANAYENQKREESPMAIWNQKYDANKKREKIEAIRLAKEAELANAD